MARKTAHCLAIGGLDPSGGAGVLADAEAIAAVGARPLVAVTTVTAQNVLAFHSAWPVPIRVLEAQLESLLCAFPVGAVKTGALPTAGHVRLVAAALRSSDAPIVVDPVLGASRGPGLVDRAVARAILEHLAPRAGLITPNAPEAAVLARRPVRNAAEAEAAATVLLDAGARAVLIKGGHLDGCGDLLATRNGRTWLPIRRVAGIATHGTGCALAAAVAAGLALGRSLPTAVRGARALVAAGLRSAVRRRAEWGPDLVGLRLDRRRQAGWTVRGPGGVY